MRIALALGAGGARGYAHIGVIQILEERGFNIAGVAGSSMGALVGGLYAAGKLDAYVDWVRTIGYREVLRLLDPAVRAPGAFRADKVMTRVGELLDGVRIEQLPVPFTAVATDLLARRAVWFQAGPLDIAVRASIALPLMITPVMVNGRLLADGGLMDPLPIAPTASIPAGAVVAVSLNGARATSHPAAPVRESADPHPTRARNHVQSDVPVSDRVGAAVKTITTGSREAASLPAGLRAPDIVSLSIEAVEDLLIRYRLAGHPPDLLIEIPTDACRGHEFHRALELIEVGRRAAVEALASSGFES
ncbi:patatin-like phospholipase family protein [Micromonospora sp. MS34]|uniref:patatin-like phospholipase family protein n=1 Tax=Micromonospora sp. MS34 TaxID=3385971 RepID=UPI0039A0D446